MVEEEKGNGNPKITAQLLASKYRGKREIYNRKSTCLSFHPISVVLTVDCHKYLPPY